jgi:outer membrane protein OmpA-like peptidoglycan-associated protein
MKRWFLALVLCVGCVPRQGLKLSVPPSELAQTTCIAVIPLTNNTRVAGAGDIVTEHLALELRRLGYSVMDRTEAKRLLAFRRIYLLDIADAEEASALGDFLGVQGVLYGSLDAYDWSPRGSTPGLAARLQMTLHLVDVESGRELWQVQLDADGMRPLGPRPAPLFAAAGQAAEQLRGRLEATLPSRPRSAGPCWEAQANTVLASLTARPAAAVKLPPVTPEQLTPAQVSLSQKLGAGGTFVLDGITFGGLSASLTPSAESAIADLARVLRAYPSAQVVLESYMDALDTDAAGISQRRGEIVVGELIQQGVDPQQISAEGKAGAKPRMPSFTEVTRAKNRRLEARVIRAPRVKVVSQKPRVKVVAGPGGQLGALQLHTALKNDSKILVARRVTQTRARRPTTVYYRAAHEKTARAIAKQIPGEPRLSPSTKLPPEIDIYVLIGGKK